MAWRGQGAGMARAGARDGGGLGCVGASAMCARPSVWVGVRLGEGSL